MHVRTKQSFPSNSNHWILCHVLSIISGYFIEYLAGNFRPRHYHLSRDYQTWEQLFESWESAQFFFSIFKSLQREMLECLEFPTSNCNSSSFSIENFFAIPSVAVKSVIIFLFIRLLNYHPSSNSSFRSSEFRTLLNGCENQTVDFEILAANQMLYGLISNRRSIIKVDIHFLNASVFLIKSNKRTRRRESQVIIENLWEKSPIKFKSNILKNSHHEIKSLFFILLHFEIFSDSLTLSFLSSIGLFECLETSKIIWNSFKMISNSSQTVGRMSRFVW